MKRIFLAIGLLCTLSNLNLNAKTYTASFKTQNDASSFMKLMFGSKIYQFESYQTIGNTHRVTFNAINESDFDRIHVWGILCDIYGGSVTSAE